MHHNALSKPVGANHGPSSAEVIAAGHTAYGLAPEGLLEVWGRPVEPRPGLVGVLAVRILRRYSRSAPCATRWSRSFRRRRCHSEAHTS